MVFEIVVSLNQVNAQIIDVLVVSLEIFGLNYLHLFSLFHSYVTESFLEQLVLLPLVPFRYV